jgi:PAS domain S-box-containing protein
MLSHCEQAMADLKEFGESASPSVVGVDESWYRLMVETVTDYAIILIDSNGFVRTWNLGAQLMKGYMADEIIGQHFSAFYPQDLIDRAWPAYELQMANEHGRFEDEGWRLRKDGSQLWANIVITRLLDSTGKLIGFSKITRDLSERRRQQELLRSSEERFRLLVENVKDYAIFMLDPDGCVASWNIGAQLNKGYSAAEIIGQHFSIFYPEDVVASGWPVRELEIALKDGRLEDEGWRVRKDGSRFWASVVITPLYDAAGVHRGFAKVTRDLTEKRKINALEDEGRRITNFLAMLGHELRNPLAPISNALAVLARGEIEAAQLRSLHEIIARQVGQMSRLVDDLLDVSRIISGRVHLNIEPMNLREAALVAVEAVTPLMQEKSHTLTMDVKADLWISGDHTRFVQILVNLLVNAAKFTPAGGRIVLAISQNGAKAEISVRDNGPGISPQLLPHIFKLFFQGEQEISRARGGLGLGLSLVRELVKLHGGELAAFSTGQPHAGSEFIIQLPTIPAPLKRLNAPHDIGAGKKQRILVVDDNRDAANTMGLLLEALGYVADIAYTGNEALEAVSKNKPNLVFLDIGLPDVSGLEVAQHIASRSVDPPLLVAVTGYGQDSDRAASSDAGFYAHLTKPVRLNDLTALLKKIFE